MNKQELIKNLRKYKEDLKNTYCDLDSIVSDVISDIYDYDNNYELDSFTYYYDTIDWIEEFIKQTLKDWWILTLKHRLSEVDSDCEWYHIDDVNWKIYPRDFSDVEDWIDDILSELDDEENETAD